MRVCICIDAGRNMPDKCERTIIFIGANYWTCKGAKSVKADYLSSSLVSVGVTEGFFAI